MGKKKVYENIFAKMIEHHNKSFVPFFKQLKRLAPSPFKISWQRILRVRDSFESNEWDYPSLRESWSERTITEYIVLNQFFFELLDEKESESAMNLMNSGDENNMYIGASMIYQFIEDKKKEILDQHGQNK